ncbi:DNA-binding protein [Halobacteriales archaeon QS_8_69_73]|nr:MAG: DNA-binding protein [Halobacteriales archaeon QS_8_69_73]
MSEDTPTILVVDDERDLADLYTAWLSEKYDVRTAYGGEEAIEMVDGSVDVALVDRLMPQTSGGDVVEYIRREGYDCGVSMVTAVETLLSRSAYDDKLREMFSVASKVAALKTQKTPQELEQSDSYQELTARLNELREEVDRTADRLTERDFEVELRQLNVD